MKPKNSGSGRRIVCLVLVAVMLLGLISSALIIKHKNIHNVFLLIN